MKQGQSCYAPALLQQSYPLPVQPASEGGSRANSLAPGALWSAIPSCASDLPSPQEPSVGKPPFAAHAGLAAMTSTMAAATRTASLFLNTSSILHPHKGEPIGPAGLYNAITLAGMRQPAHLTVDESIRLLGRHYRLRTFPEFRQREVRLSPGPARQEIAGEAVLIASGIMHAGRLEISNRYLGVSSEARGEHG